MPIKIPATFLLFFLFFFSSPPLFFRNYQADSKVCMENKGLRIAKQCSKNYNNGLIHSDFKNYYKATLIKTVWFNHKERYTDQ